MPSQLCLFLQNEQPGCVYDSGQPGGDQHLPADARPIAGGVHQVSPSQHTQPHCSSILCSIICIGPSSVGPLYWRDVRLNHIVGFLYLFFLFSVLTVSIDVFYLCFFLFSRLPESQQRVGGFFLNLMPQMKALYVGYCSNHPSAVNVLTQHRYVNKTSSVQLHPPFFKIKIISFSIAVILCIPSQFIY